MLKRHDSRFTQGKPGGGNKKKTFIYRLIIISQATTDNVGSMRKNIQFNPGFLKYALTQTQATGEICFLFSFCFI